MKANRQAENYTEISEINSFALIRFNANNGKK